MTAQDKIPDKEYHAIPFTLDHHEKMNVLFRSAFGTSLTKAAFLKRFDTRALGGDVTGYIAIHKASGSPAAYYGVFPVQLTWKGMVFLAAQSGDTMTHTDHRKKGLFTWLAKKTYDACTEKGIRLVFGLPNKNSFPGFIRKLNWIQVDEVVRYDLKQSLPAPPLFKLCARLSLSRSYLSYATYLLKRLAVDPGADWTNHFPSAMAKVVRNEAYIKYKQDKDKFFIDVGGIIFWIRLSDVFWIGEISDYEKVTPVIISKLKRIAYRLGYNTISYHCNVGLNAPFLSGFKKYNTEPSCFLDLDGSHKDFNIALTAADFDTW